MSIAVVAFMLSSLPVVLFRAARHAGRSALLSLLSSAIVFLALAWLGRVVIGDGAFDYSHWITGMA